MTILPEHGSEKEADEWAKQDRDEFAEQRSHDASKIAYDFQKTTAQACLLINGGAATAVVALLAKEVDAAILKTVPWCLCIYALGVAISAFMMFCSMMRSEGWNYFWYHFSYTTDEKRGREHEARAVWWERAVKYAFAAAIACFLIASFWLAISLGPK